MDLAYLQFLNQVGVNPIDYLQTQASYLRFLARSYSRSHEKSKSSTFSSKYENQSLKATKQTEITTEDEMTTNKKNYFQYEDIPIKPCPPFDQMISDEIRKISRNNNENSENPSKFQYLKKKSRNLSVNPVFSYHNMDKKTQPNKVSHRKNYSVNDLKKNEAAHKTFLKKGQGKLCSQTSNFSKSLSLSPSSHKNLKHTKSSPNSHMNSKKGISSHKSIENLQRSNKSASNLPKNRQKSNESTKKFTELTNKTRTNLHKSLFFSASPQRSPAKSVQRPLEDSRYKKMLKDLQDKSKRFEQDSKEFFKAKEQQLCDLESLKKDVKSQVLYEKISLHNEILTQTKSKPGSFNMADEVKGLKEKITQQEENFSSAIKELQGKIERLRQENDELVVKYKALQPANLLRPSRMNARLNDSKSIENGSGPRSRSKEVSIPKLNLDRVVDLDPKKTFPKANLQRSYFSQKK